jgi:hypothetical protein
MSEAFDAYTQANGRMKAAEESANRIVVELKRVFGPIFTNWKGCYLNGLERQIPIVLARSGRTVERRTEVNVANVGSELPKLLDAMIEYAEAQEAAFSAYERIPASEKELIAAPVWNRPR